MLVVNNDEILFRKYITGEEERLLQENCIAAFHAPVHQKDIDRIEKSIIKLDNCWEYSFKESSDGYFKTGLKYKTIRVHRLIYQLHNPAENIKDKIIRHICDNKRCVNFRHLLSGTNDDNMKDMVERELQCRGSRINTAVLNEDQVLQILHGIQSGEIKTTKEICDQYKLSRAMPQFILNGKSWTHITKNFNLPELKQKLKEHDDFTRHNKCGEQANSSKLTTHQVVEIKKMLANGVSMYRIAKLYNMGETTIWHIKHNDNWKHVKIED